MQSYKTDGKNREIVKSTGGFHVMGESLIKESNKQQSACSMNRSKASLNQMAVKKHIMMLKPTIMIQKIDGRSQTPLNYIGNSKQYRQELDMITKQFKNLGNPLHTVVHGIRSNPGSRSRSTGSRGVLTQKQKGLLQGRRFFAQQHDNHLSRQNQLATTQLDEVVRLVLDFR